MKQTAVEHYVASSNEQPELLGEINGTRQAGKQTRTSSNRGKHA
jgi:hypothetical protein